MARIRSIKPEFPQSESMGRVSREARLCFILLWTQADDSGTLRGHSRMLASLLYPYDDDSKDLVPIWLEELAIENCIEIHEVDGDRYIKICNWLKHQKIDKPSKSKFPSLRESSRVFVEASRKIALDQGSRIKEGIKDKSLPEKAKPSARKARGALPNPSEVSKGTGETRHSRIQGMIMQAYQEQNGVECPWNGAEGKQLKIFLEKTPRWTDQQIAQCLMNLYASEGFPKGTEPKEFLTYLPKYLKGPLNQFKQSENGNGHRKPEPSASAKRIIHNAAAFSAAITNAAIPISNSNVLVSHTNGIAGDRVLDAGAKTIQGDGVHGGGQNTAGKSSE